MEKNHNIEQVDIFLNEMKNTKKYIDWYAIYMKEVESWLKLTNIKQKKGVLQEYVDRIYVSYDGDDAKHKVDIQLKLALFDDIYNVLERTGRKRVYEVAEGTKEKSFYLEKTKVGRKKKVQVALS